VRQHLEAAARKEQADLGPDEAGDEDEDEGAMESELVSPYSDDESDVSDGDEIDAVGMDDADEDDDDHEADGDMDDEVGPELDE